MSLLLLLFGAACGLLTLISVVLISAPWAVLQQANLHAIVIATVLVAGSCYLWSAIWANIVRKHAACARNSRVLSVSMASMIGMLTPLHLGTDVLRSLYGKHVLALPYSTTAAASIVTRTLRLHVNLAALTATLTVGLIYSTRLAGHAVAAILVSVTLLGALAVLRSRASGELSTRLGVGDIAEPARTVMAQVGTRERFRIYAAFGAGLTLEWLALHLCLVSLGYILPAADTLMLFMLLFLVSRTAPTPQGFVLVEASGAAALSTTGLSSGEVGAFLVLWDFVRVGVPIALAAVYSARIGLRSAAETSKSTPPIHIA